eukprot:scaffold134489_cov31-Prasinocladus_malaysianus.AAC.3
MIICLWRRLRGGARQAVWAVSRRRQRSYLIVQFVNRSSIVVKLAAWLFSGPAAPAWALLKQRKASVSSRRKFVGIIMRMIYHPALDRRPMWTDDPRRPLIRATGSFPRSPSHSH